MEKYMLPCFSKQLFGLDCPGCGSQRALFLVLRGEFSLGFEMFPAIYTSILFFVFLALQLLNRSRDYTKALIALAIGNGLLIFVSYLYKIIKI